MMALPLFRFHPLADDRRGMHGSRSRPMKNPNHPGDIIRGCLDELGMNATEGAKALDVTRAALSRLLNGKAGLSAETAVRLEKAIGSTAGFWPRLRLNYDLAQIQARRFTPAASALRRAFCGAGLLQYNY
jgi:addiction module HigA family antidote